MTLHLIVDFGGKKIMEREFGIAEEHRAATAAYKGRSSTCST